MNFRKALSLSLLALALLPRGAFAVLAPYPSHNLTTARHSETITLLPDGNLLVVGGISNAGTTLATAEIYNNATSAFSAVPSMAVARSSHTATLLGNGKVLVAGGFTQAGAPIGSAQIFDPVTRTWEAAILMGRTRGAHTANLINAGDEAGGALLCGGYTNTGTTGVTATCEIYSIADGVFYTNVASMVTGRMNHAAAALDSGNIFVSGGIDDSGNYLPSNEIYNAAGDYWTPATALLEGRAFHTATVMNTGDVMIAGGYNGANKFLLSTNEKWYYINRNNANIAFQDAGSHGYLDGAEFFDPNGGRVPVTAQGYAVMPYRTSHHASIIAPGGRVAIHGGSGNFVPTFFKSAPVCIEGSYMNLSPTGTNTSRILPTSSVSFPLHVQLDRPVSGRMVDGDIFFSGPPPASEKKSFDLGIFSAYLSSSVVRLDGFPVGSTTGDPFVAGEFDTSSMTLRQPVGTAAFQPISGSDPDALLSTTHGAVTMAALPVGESSNIDIASIRVRMKLTLSPAFRGGQIRGRATITSGMITDKGSLYSINLSTGSGTIPSGTYPVVPIVNGDGTVTSFYIYFTGVSGTVANTTDTAITSGDVDFSNDTLSNFSILLHYTSDIVSLYTNAVGATYSVDVSSFVARKMIFSTDLGLDSDKFEWMTSTSPYDMSLPTMDHSYVISAAGDELLIGGRNCEGSTSDETFSFCTRADTHLASIPSMQTVISVPEGGWTLRNPLNHKRAYNTGTLLADGRILTCGGSDGTTALESCEIKVSSGSWSYTGSMTSPRARHTATLLPNGTVLMAGGSTGTGLAATDTAEVYYPATGRFVATQKMNNARLNHTATLLPDGNVLVAGGSSQSTYSATAELYITTAATWQAVPKMNGGRAQHTATLLRDGRVMVAGGINGGALSSSNIYNPNNRTWSAGPAMNYARYAHTATMLRDGRVMVIGGSNGYAALPAMEFCTSAACTEYFFPNGDRYSLGYERANHRSTLLTNGKVLLTGGETSGAGQSMAEIISPDILRTDDYGQAASRINHAAVMDLNGDVHIIGGWDGTKYLATTESVYFAAAQDEKGMSPKYRAPKVSTSTFVDYRDLGQRMTLISNTTNFHGLTEATGGGTSNTSFHNPRIYFQSMDAASGFLLDLSTYIYSAYGGINSWENTRSSITIILPTGLAELPWGYYYARGAANGQYSNGRVVQITTPRPTEVVSDLVPLNSPYWRGTSSITWQWDPPATVTSVVNGYNIYSSTSGLFISTVAYEGNPTPSYTQTDLAPNTKASVMVNLYNLGGDGPLIHSSTFYTLAKPPTGLTVTAAGFNSASLAWNTNGNSAYTAYEISYCAASDFPPGCDVKTASQFSQNLTSSFTVIAGLKPNVEYFFRVQARNGAVSPSFTYGGGGVATDFSNSASTLTVASIIDLSGVATSSAAIAWSWTCSDSSPADFYSIYDVSADTNAPVWLDDVDSTSFDQVDLLPNSRHRIRVVASVNGIYGTLSGPPADSTFIYTLAEPPAAGTPSGIVPSSTSLVAQWQTLANSSITVYNVQLSTMSDFSSGITTMSVKSSSAVFSGLTPNVLYYAQVKAVNGDGRATNPATVSLGHLYTLCAPPSNVRASTVSMSGVTIDWDANGNSADTYYQVCATTQSSFNLSFSTPIAFTRLYYGRTLALTGLLTDTEYLFNVQARNGDGADSAKTQISPSPLRTAAGPSGSPAGAIGGSSSPSADVSFAGTLANGRYVAMTVPAGAFRTTTGLAIAPSVNNRCSQSIPLVALSVYSQEDAQPETPVTLRLNYSQAEATGLNGIGVNSQHIVLARYNPISGDCLPLDTQLDTGNRLVTATINHFSEFQLIVKPSVSDLASVRVYPNPLYLNRGNGYATIEPVPAYSKIRIYTLSGEKVWEGSGGSTGVIIWRGVNKSGLQVASGIYLAVIDSTAGKKTLKIAVER